MKPEALRRAWMNRPVDQMSMSLEEWTNGCVPSAPKPAPAAARPRHEPGKMNGLEKRYAQHLHLRQTVGEIAGWKFEPLKLRLAKGTYYSPDFLIEKLDGTMELHETKGFMEEDAAVKIKVAAEMFPRFNLTLVTEDKATKAWKFKTYS